MGDPYRTPGKPFQKPSLTERARNIYEQYWKQCKTFCLDKAEIRKDDVEKYIIRAAQGGFLHGMIEIGSDLDNHPYFDMKVYVRALNEVFKEESTSELRLWFEEFGPRCLKFHIGPRDKEGEAKREASEAILSLTRGMD